MCEGWRARQLGVVSLRELVGAVVGKAVGDGIEVGAVEPPHRHGLHPEALRGLEASVPRDDLAGAARHDGLLPAEPAQGRGDVGDRGVVEARVAR